MGLHNPWIYESTPQGERQFDLFSRLLKERIVFICGTINDEISAYIMAQLVFLEYEDAEKDITLYINSPGGYVDAGLAIYDTMQFIKPDVSTICVGQCASMGAVLAAAGTKGKRFALPHSKFMIHQPLGGATGQAADIAIHAKEIIKTKDTLAEILANHTGKRKATIRKDTERDNHMTAAEALKYGLIDEILESRA